MWPLERGSFGHGWFEWEYVADGGWPCLLLGVMWLYASRPGPCRRWPGITLADTVGFPTRHRGSSGTLKI